MNGTFKESPSSSPMMTPDKPKAEPEISPVDKIREITDTQLSTINPSYSPNSWEKRPYSRMTPSYTHLANRILGWHNKPGHHLSECISFSRKPIRGRRDHLKTKVLCFMCVNNHRFKDCNTEVQCTTCKSKEHTHLLHAWNSKTIWPGDPEWETWGKLQNHRGEHKMHSGICHVLQHDSTMQDLSPRSPLELHVRVSGTWWPV